ncbi:MAG: ribonuclease PH [Gemmatimonadota bacterium]|nr:ribonuclease PH [Gemmatimonadota bacterium]
MSHRRHDGRDPADLRPVAFELGAAPQAEGSCLVSFGRTRVLCAASVLEGVPAHREGKGGWITAEYAMLPRSTHTRTDRERSGPRGRTQEIQRLIGRSLRAAADLSALGPHTVVLDCDVLSADGGTRTASITGAWIALHEAERRLREAGRIERPALPHRVAAVSVGLVDGRACLDLDYREDSRAGVDLNVVALDDGRFVEVQGTAEGSPFGRDELAALLDLAESGIRRLIAAQDAAVDT